MSKTIVASSAQLAPVFPAKGYLPTDLAEVLAQRRKQQEEISESCMAARAEGKAAPCDQVLNISLFFDGTNNHQESDSKAQPRNTSNVARLFHSTINDDDAVKCGYFTYYVQGVGTQFVEIDEQKPDPDGLKYASGGERRILWGMTRLIDALRRSVGLGIFDLLAAKALIRKMEVTEVQARSQRGNVNEYRRATTKERVAAMTEALAPIEAQLQSYTPKVLKIKLFVYGFSRGAAEARAFVGRLAEVCGKGLLGTTQIPISIQFLGLFDTVASVGLASVVGGAEGHMDWADDSMQLPDDTNLLQVHSCAHFVSAHEQRLCFPVDSVRKKDGSYPASVIGEWVYPGVHSDVGGGYPPGDQGKAMGEQGLLISQLGLHHMYRLAFAAGAPLQIKRNDAFNAHPDKLAVIESWRWMDDHTEKEFDLKNQLISRFNRWRAVAGGDASVDELLMRQTAQLTAWRILRYAGGLRDANNRIQPNGQGQSQADYYRQAKDDPEWLIEQQKKEWEKQSKAPSTNAEPVVLRNPQDPEQTAPYKPNKAKTFEPARDQTQLREAADEFEKHYLGQYRPQSFTGGLASFALGFTRVFSEDCGSEYGDLREEGEEQYAELIKPENAELVAFYDNHIHDSRAWFMHSSLKAREPNGSYFRYRTIFYSDGNTNKKEVICKAPSRKQQAQKSNATQHAEVM